MDTQFVNAVLTSLDEVLLTMLDMQATAGERRIKHREEMVPGLCVTGLISINNQTAHGSLGLTFTDAVVFEMGYRMLGERKSMIDGMLIDLAGEMSNMVMGCAKNKLEESGERFDLALPTVIMGRDYLIAHRLRSPVMLVPFTTEAGSFFVEMGFERSQ